MKQKRWQKPLALSFIVIMLLIVYLPIIVLIVFSFTEMKGGKLTGFSLEAYQNIAGATGLLDAALNTLILAGSSALIATLLGTFAAIGIYNMKSKAARTLMSGANQIPVVNADIVTAVSIFLLFIFLNNIGIRLENEWIHLIVGHTVITTPFVILTVTPRLRQLNPNVYEAALDLGATPFQATLKVLLPQIFTAMLAAFALAFTLSIDDFVITQYNSVDVSTISTYIYKMLTGRTGTSASVKEAARAFSAILFVVIMGVLLLINIRSAKANKNKNRMPK